MRGLAQPFRVAPAVGALDEAHLLGRVGDEQPDQLASSARGRSRSSERSLVQGLQV